MPVARARPMESAITSAPAPVPAMSEEQARVVELLASTPWADAFEHHQLQLFARYLHIVYADAGVLLFNEGSLDHFLSILVDGKVEILKEDSTGAKHVVVTLGRGKTFGELSLMDDGPRSSTARVKENCTILQLDEDDFSDLEAAQPALAAKILRHLARMLSQRLRMTSGRLVDHLP